MVSPFQTVRSVVSRAVYLVAAGSAFSFVAACGAPTAVQPAASNAVLSRDQFGQVQTQTAPAVDTESPAWLAGLEPGDVLTYRIEAPDSAPRTLRVRVDRMRREGKSAAALLVPISDTGEANDSSFKPHWIAGDAEGLYELRAHESLLDPGFTPLDGNGRVIDSGREGALFRVPQSWDEVIHHEETSVVGGWAVEELDLSLDGPVRGDRCARISKQLEGTLVRMTVCANVGMVDLQRGGEQELGERWELVEISRVTP